MRLAISNNSMASVSAAAAALGARPRLLSMLEPTPPRAAWRATPAAGAARRDPALFLQLAGVGAGPRDDAAAWAALSAPEELALVVAALVGRGLVASTPAHVRRVERLLEEVSNQYTGHNFKQLFKHYHLQRLATVQRDFDGKSLTDPSWPSILRTEMIDIHRMILKACNYEIGQRLLASE